MIGALWLLGGLLTAPGAGAPPSPSSAAQEEPDRYAALVAEFDLDQAAWVERCRASTDAEEMRELRANRPAVLYFPRFEALAEDGICRGLLWCVAHVGDSGLPGNEKRPYVERGLRTLVTQYGADPSFGLVLDQVAREERALGAALTRELYELAVLNAVGGNRAEALLALARLLRASSAEGAREAALAAYARVVEGFPETRYAELALEEAFVVEHLSVGGIAPDFDALDAEGRAVKLSDYRGQVVLLDFWGFWCPKCQGELPYLVELVERLAGEPFVLLGVNTDKDEAAYRAQCERLGVRWRSVWDGDPNGPVTTLYRIRRFPSAFLLDGEGRIHAVEPSAIAASRQVDRLLAEAKRAKR